jgi:hypothetical protein
MSYDKYYFRKPRNTLFTQPNLVPHISKENVSYSEYTDNKKKRINEANKLNDFINSLNEFHRIQIDYSPVLGVRL